MNDMGAVAENLHLYMAGARDELLEIEAAVAERRLGLRGGLIEPGLELSSVLSHPYPAPAAARMAGERSERRPADPGTTGTPAFCAAPRKRRGCLSFQGPTAASRISRRPLGSR